MEKQIRAAAVTAVVALVASTMGVAGSVTPARADTAIDWGNLDTTGLDELADPLAKSTPMVFLLGLTASQDRAAAVRAVSDPRSASYGSYSAPNEILAAFGATDETVTTVEAFFAGEGLTAKVDPTRTYAQVVMTVEDAERIFATTWAGFEYPESSPWEGLVELYPTSTPQLPAALSGLVQRVHGAVRPAPELSSSDSGSDDPAEATDAQTSTGESPIAGGLPFRSGTADGCEQALALNDEGNPLGLSPSQLLTAYGIDELHELGARGEGMNLAVVENQRYSPANLTTYAQCFGLDVPNITNHESGSLPPADDSTSPEAILDLSVLGFVAPAVDRLDVYMVGRDPAVAAADPMGTIDFMKMFAAPIEAALSGGARADVVSASYGLCDASPLLLGDRTALVGIFEDVFALAAVMGMTYAVSTGDDGSSECNQLSKDIGGQFPMLAVAYPASSQFVTAVGGTNLALDEQNTIVSSGVWNDTAYAAPGEPLPDELRSGGTGGTSKMVPKPWYQQGVNGTDNRSVPDVSLFADELPGYMIHADEWTNVGGTSASAPLFAGMVTLLGQLARATGQPTLGFATPLVYELASSGSDSLLDITIGDNIIFPEPSFGISCCAAAAGYDLATGWGSPIASRVATTLTAPSVTLGGSVDPEGTVTLRADVSAGHGTPLRYQWDLDGDAEIDLTTETDSVSFDITDFTSTGATAGETAVLGTSSETTIEAAVLVTTSLGRQSLAAATIDLVAASPTPVGAPLSIAG